ncbi:MAG: type III secretion system gatekeeper subunit SctW [Kiritimatiellae bacterium]|nr:type III secretion system gatekeeper subunit SctW [Kiritimatiellia bacterium]
MAFDAAQFLRHSIAPDRIDQFRSAEMSTAAQTPAEVGRAMGMAVVVEQNPAAELQDAMEELSMHFEEKAAKKLGERNLGETRSRASAYADAVKAWEKVLPDMPGKEFLDRMLRGLRQAMQNGGQLPDASRLLDELARGSGDPSHQFAMLELLEAALGEGDEALHDLLGAAREKLIKEKGPELSAGINLAREVNSRATTPEEMQSLRDMYRGEVIGFTTPQDCFRSLVATRGMAGLSAAIEFLLAGCGADLQSPSPSQAPEELRRIMLDLQCVQVLRTVFDKLSALVSRMAAQFGETCRFGGEAMTGKVLDFTERPFVSSRDISGFVSESGIAKLLAQMDFCRELMGVFRQLSSRLFSSEDDRTRLLDATQEHLDGLVALEDEAEEEGEGES